MFLPMTVHEMEQLGWDRPDVILVSGDAYIDSPHIGIAVIGKYLVTNGFRTAVIAQPSSQEDIGRLGEPALFWGVSGGCIDSMVANYTPAKKFRHRDDYSPDGVNVRPDRACIVYVNRIRKCFKRTVPVVLGGLEASLRRIAHYDYWSNAVRRSILFDSGADILAYGMAERTVLDLAERLRDSRDWRQIQGICLISRDPVREYETLPSYEEVAGDTGAFMEMSLAFQRNLMNGVTGFNQRHGGRFLIHNPPRPSCTQPEIDSIYEMAFERASHPSYGVRKIRALETIRQSITGHRGCFGNCHFCAITIHQGRHVVSRSTASILKEAGRITRLPGFNGIIYDVGGPTANMFGFRCRRNWVCRRMNCMVPEPCPNLIFGHDRQIDLLNRLLDLPGVRKVFVSSGIRHDMVVADRRQGKRYVEHLVRNHVSGQLKLAPEHSDPEVLALMNKPGAGPLLEFKNMFDAACRKFRKRYFLTYYLMAAHPGCTIDHMKRLKAFLSDRLKLIPEQVQIFTPTPGTLSTAMYHCGTDLNGRPLPCETALPGAVRQKRVLKRDDRFRIRRGAVRKNL
ncbi:YgiQ family radical SAM protein [bacterium]|nr:YgiQ family radical SAM protein [candidate division CSSED10-310 bacterium]